MEASVWSFLPVDAAKPNAVFDFGSDSVIGIANELDHFVD